MLYSQVGYISTLNKLFE